jgi:hypothetical protein
MIAAIFILMFGSFIYAAATGGISISNKQSCINAGGKWSEGIQYGRITQLCTYN